MRALTVRATVPGTVVLTVSASSARPSNGAARSSSVSSSGLPAVVSKQASTNAGSASIRVRTSAATPAGESGDGRSSRVAGAVASPSSSACSAPGSTGRAAIASSTGRSSTRRASASRKRRLGASAQCASSTTTSSGCSAARFAHSQYNPYSVEWLSPSPLATAAPKTGSASAAAPANSRSRRSGAATVQLGLEQLADDPEREVALERRARGGQHAQPGLGRAGAQHPQQRRLALPGGCLQQRDRPARRAGGGELSGEPLELGPALEQRGHRPKSVTQP